MKNLITRTTLFALLALVAVPALANGGAPCPCTPYSTTIVSDETNTVVGDGSAVAVAAHPAWTAVIPGSTTWVWKASPTAPDEVVGFEKSFTVSGATVLSATLDIATDNSYAVFIDGAPVASDTADNNFQLGTQDSHNLTASVSTGTHTLRIEVKNVGAYDVGSNPAGLLYKLVVESQTCPPPCCEGDVDVKVKNTDTTVINIVGTSANSGWNTADGGSATTKVKKSGNVKGTDNDGNTTSAGGNSSTGGSGGAVVTGDATAKSKVKNNVNSTVIRVRRI